MAKVPKNTNVYKGNEYDTEWHEGSAGSKWANMNIKRYPYDAPGDEAVTNRDEYSPDKSDYPFEANARRHKLPTPTETIRRQNNRARDRAHRFAVITGPIAVDTNSVAGVTPEHLANADAGKVRPPR